MAGAPPLVLAALPTRHTVRVCLLQRRVELLQGQTGTLFRAVDAALARKLEGLGCVRVMAPRSVCCTDGTSHRVPTLPYPPQT